MTSAIPEDYSALATKISKGLSVHATVAALLDLWSSRYASTARPTLIEHFEHGGAHYLFDRAGDTGARHPDRTIAAFGFAAPPALQRDVEYQATFPLTERYGRPLDRGHMFPHSGGGLFGPNVFPQDRALNRGWSDSGRRYRAIETQAVTRGQFFFCHLLYCDASDMPAAVELGTVREAQLRVESFQNRFDADAVVRFPVSVEDVLSSLTNAQLADLGEETVRFFLESHLDATIIALGDSRLPRDEGRQDMDIVALIDGEVVAIEVKSRYFASRAGKLTSAGNIHRPRLRSAGRTSRQGTQTYAAERLKQFLDVDGEVRMLVAAADLRARVVQLFPMRDGHIQPPEVAPEDCTDEIVMALEALRAGPAQL
jgi:hypothetical protein